MAGYIMKMSILVSNLNHHGEKDFSFKFTQKEYAAHHHQYLKRQKIELN